MAMAANGQWVDGYQVELQHVAFPKKILMEPPNFGRFWIFREFGKSSKKDEPMTSQCVSVTFECRYRAETLARRSRWTPYEIRTFRFAISHLWKRIRHEEKRGSLVTDVALSDSLWCRWLHSACAVFQGSRLRLRPVLGCLILRGMEGNTASN